MNWPLVKELGAQWGVQILLALDQLLNAFLRGFADETLSARCYRAHRDGKIFGKLFMPPIDRVFGLWQGPGHCKGAYLKEFARKNYPSEYQGGTPIFESRSKAK